MLIVPAVPLAAMRAHLAAVAVAVPPLVLLAVAATLTRSRLLLGLILLLRRTFSRRIVGVGATAPPLAPGRLVPLPAARAARMNTGGIPTLAAAVRPLPQRPLRQRVLERLKGQPIQV